MATTKRVEYNKIPKLSKVSVPVTLKAGVDASTVSVVLTIPSGLSVMRGTVSAGSFDGTDTWTVGTTSAGTDYTATFDFITTEQYSSGWEVTATVSTEPEDKISEDNVITVSIVEEAQASEIATSFVDGLTYYDGSAAQKVQSVLMQSGGDYTWKVQDIAMDLSVVNASAFSGVTLSIPSALADQVTAGTIEPEAYVRSADNSILVYPGALAVNAAVEANDGGASSASLGLDNASAVNVADGTAFSSTFSGRLIVSFFDADLVA